MWAEASIGKELRLFRKLREYIQEVRSKSILRRLRKYDHACGIVRHLNFIFILVQWKGIEELEEEGSVNWVA